MMNKNIECPLHGKQEIGLLCTHLAHSLIEQTNVGFHEFDDGDLGRPDAWCNTCEQNLAKVTNDNEQEKWFLECDYKIVCAACWDEAKKLNLQAKNNDLLL